MKAQTDIFTIWRQSKRSREAVLERARREMLGVVIGALNSLSERYTWDEVWVFGSLTRPGCFGPQSDVDIAIRGLSKFDHYALVGDLSMILGRPVDVVRLEDCPFARRTVEKGIPWKTRQSH